jgi:hypothetical protein|nr:hypothetical protein [Neorhizobium tomejilense]
MLTPSLVWNHWLSSGHLELKESAIPSLFEEGINPRLMVVTGENGGGKSLAIEIFRRISADMATAEGSRLEVIDIGMKRRVAAGIERTMIFGHEATESTGNVSIRTALKGIENSRTRDNDHWLVLDEPDIGVGDGYHEAIGQYLAAYGSNLPPLCSGLVVVSHSRAIVAELLNAGASSLRVGPDLRPVWEWIARGDIRKSVDDLLALQDEVRSTKSRVTELFNTLREEGRSAGQASVPRTIRV